MAFRIVWLAAALTLPLIGQHRESNPFSSAADLAEGERLYRTNCGVCHGMEGKTGRGARLAVRDHRHGNSDAEMFRVIQNGVPGTDMPGLWLDEDATWKILLFVRTLEVNAATPARRPPGTRRAAPSCSPKPAKAAMWSGAKAGGSVRL